VVAASFFASLSWVLVQPHHLLFHPRYATIVMAFPFGIFLAAAIPRWQYSRGEPAMRAASCNQKSRPPEVGGWTPARSGPRFTLLPKSRDRSSPTARR
jgi:hypothetical protein